MGKMTLKEAQNKINDLKTILNGYLNGEGIKLFADTSKIQKEILELCELQRIVNSNVKEFEYNDVTQKADARCRAIGDTVLPYYSLNKVIQDIIGQRKTEYDSINRINELVDYYNREGIPGDHKAKVFYEEHIPFGEGNLEEKEEFVNLYRTNEAIRFANPSKAKSTEELLNLFIEGRNKQSVKEKREQAKLEEGLNNDPLGNAPTRDYGTNVNKYNINLAQDNYLERIKFEKAKVLLKDDTIEAVNFQKEFYIEMINKMLDLPDHKLALSNSDDADRYYQNNFNEINMLLNIEELFGGPNLDSGLKETFEISDEIISVLKHKSELAKTFIAKSKDNILMRSKDPVSFELLDTLSEEERNLALNNMIILPERVKRNRFKYLESKKNIQNEINDLPKPSYSMDGYHVNPHNVFIYGAMENYPTLDDKIEELSDLDLKKGMTKKMTNFRNAILTCNTNIKRNDISHNLRIQSYLELKNAATLFANSLSEKEISSDEGQNVINYINDLKSFIDKATVFEEMRSIVSIYENSGKITRTRMDDIVEVCDMYFDIDHELDGDEFNPDVTDEEKRELKNALHDLTSKLFKARTPYTPLKSYFGAGNISIGIGNSFAQQLMVAFNTYKNLPKNFMLDKIRPKSILYKDLTKFYGLLDNVKDLSQEEVTSLLKEHTAKTLLKNISHLKHSLKEAGYKQNVPDNVLVEKLIDKFEKSKSDFFGETYRNAILEVAYENRTVGEELEYQESIIRRYMDKELPAEMRANVEGSIAKIEILKGIDKNTLLPNKEELESSVKGYLKDHLNVVYNIQMNGSDAIKRYFNHPESINVFEFEHKELAEPNLTLAYKELREKLGRRVDVSNLPEDFIPKALTQTQKDAKTYLEKLNEVQLTSNIVRQIGPLYGNDPKNWDRLFSYFLKTPYKKEDVLYNAEIIKNIYENKVDEKGVPYRRKILLEKLEEIKKLDPNELVGLSDEDLVNNFEKLRTTWGLAFAGRQDFINACKSEGIEFSDEEIISIDMLNDQATYAYSPLSKRMNALGNPYWEIGEMLNSDQLDLKDEKLDIKHASRLLNDIATNRVYIDTAEERSNIQKAFVDSGIYNLANKKNLRFQVYDDKGKATAKPINDVYGALLGGEIFSIKTPKEVSFYQYDKKNKGLVIAGSYDGIAFKLKEVDTTLHLENREYEKSEYLDKLKALRETVQNKVILSAFFKKEDIARVLVLDDIIIKLNNVYNNPNADLYFKSYAKEDFIQDSVNQLVKEERFTNFVKDYIDSDTIPDNIAVYTAKDYFGYDAQTGEFFITDNKTIQKNRTRKYDAEIPTNTGETLSNEVVIDMLYTAHSELNDKIINLREASKKDIARLIVYASLKKEIENATDDTFDQIVSNINEGEINRRIKSMIETREFITLIDKLGGTSENDILNRVPSRFDITNLYTTYQGIQNNILNKCEHIIRTEEYNINSFNALTDEEKTAAFEDNNEVIYNFKLAADLKRLRESDNPENFLSNAGSHMPAEYEEGYKKDLRELWKLDNNINPWNEKLTLETTAREIENTKKEIRDSVDKISRYDTIPGSFSSEGRMKLLKIGFLKHNLKNNLGYSLKEIENLAYKYEYDDNFREIRDSIIKQDFISSICNKVVKGNQEGIEWEDRISGLLEYYDKKEKGDILTAEEYLDEIKKTRIVSLEEEKEFMDLCALNNSVRFANPSKVKTYDEIWNVQHDLELQKLHEESIEHIKKMDGAEVNDYKFSSKACFSRSYRYNFDKSFPIGEKIKLEKSKLLLNGNTKEALEFQKVFLAEMINKAISISEDKLSISEPKEAIDFLVKNSNDIMILFEIENIMSNAKNDFEIPQDIINVIMHKKNLCQEHLQKTSSSVKINAHKDYKASKLFGDLTADEIRIAQSAEGDFTMPRDVKNALVFLQIEKYAKAETTEKNVIDYSMDNHYLNSKDIKIKVIPTPEKTIKDLNNRFKSLIDKEGLRENGSFNELKEALDLSNDLIRVSESLEENKFVYDGLLKKANSYIASMNGRRDLTADETNAINFAKEVKTECDYKSKLFANKIEVAKLQKEFGAETNIIDRILNASQNGYKLENDIRKLKDANQNPLVNNSVLSLLSDAGALSSNVTLNDEKVFGKNNVANFKNSNLAGYLLSLQNKAKTIDINELNKLRVNPELYDAVKKIYYNAMKLPDNIEGINLLIENRSRLSILENLPRIRDELKKYGYAKEISDSDLADLVQEKIKSYAATDSPIENSVKEIVYNDRTIKEELEFRNNRIRIYGNRDLKDNEWAELTRDIAFVLRYKDEIDGPLGGLNKMEESITSYLIEHKDLMVNMLNHDKELVSKAINDPTKLLEEAVLKDNMKELPNVSNNYQMALGFLRENGINTDNISKEYTDVPFDEFKKGVIEIESKYEGLDPSKGNILSDEIGNMLGKKCPNSFGRVIYHLLKPITSKENLKYDIDLMNKVASNTIGNNGVPFRKKILLDKLDEIKRIDFNKYTNMSNEDILKNIEEIKGIGGLALMATGTFKSACEAEGIEFNKEEIQELGIIENKAMALMGPLKEMLVAKSSPNEYIFDQLNLSQEQLDRLEGEPSFENHFFMNSMRGKQEKEHYDMYSKSFSEIEKCNISNIPNKAECKVKVYKNGVETVVDFKNGFSELSEGSIVSISEKNENYVEGQQEPKYKNPVFYKYDSNFGTILTSDSLEGINKQIDTRDLGKFNLEIPGNSAFNMEAGYNNSVNQLKQDLISKVKLNEKDLATLIVVDAVKKNMDKYKENPDMYKAMLNAFVNEDYIEDNVQTIQNSGAFKNYVNELGGINEKGYINTKLLSNEILNGKAFDKYVAHQNKLDEIKNKEIAERKEAILRSKISEYNSLSPEKKEDFLKREFKLNRDFMEYRKLQKEGAIFEKALQDRYDLCYEFKLRADSEKLLSLDDPIEINNFLNEIGSTSKEGDIVDKEYIKEVEDNAKALDKKTKVEKKQELRMEEI